ncbi:hypothetical protein CYCD_26320 [Tenuifilaceae bacterium CYCD]|nr:hypothetical protein CYCD_26320 [Tenuifilaceae bacterium CYCD]
MNKKIYLLLAFIGMIGLFSNCEKDEDKVTMPIDPVVPIIKTMPDLTLLRSNATDTIEFVGTPVDLGFNASATYFLEVTSTTDVSFDNALILYSGVQDTLIRFTISDLNSMLLQKFTADQTSSANFRIRAALVVDAGTGAMGTSTNPIEYNSTTTTTDITIYGLPRLDVIVNSSVIGKVESALGNGDYLGYIKFTNNSTFTLKDPDNDIIYGDNAGALEIDGTGIAVTDDNGWHKLQVNTNELTYELKLFQIGLIGDATPNGWSAPDQKMDYDSQSGAWIITLNLTVGGVKFRVNDDWSGGINLGIGDADHPEYTINNLWNNGGSQNIPITTAGNYTVKLYIGTSTYKCTFTKN